MKKKYIDYKIIFVDKVTSTNSELKSLIRKNNKLNNVCLCAENQSKGYGRRNTKWFSYNGNIHLSILIKPNCILSKINQLAFVTSISIGEVIKKISKKKEIKYKWPNDILLNKRKLAGVLIETSSNIKKIKWAVIGVGVNIKKHPNFKNNNFLATSLNKEKIFIEKKVLINLFVSNFFKNYSIWKKNGFSQFKNKWVSKLYNTKNAIIIKYHDKINKGKFLNLYDDGSLKLLVDNKVKKFSFGDQII